MKEELKRFELILTGGYQECSEGQCEEEKEAFLKITLNFLRRMKQETLADCLQSSKRILINDGYT